MLPVCLRLTVMKSWLSLSPPWFSETSYLECHIAVSNHFTPFKSSGHLPSSLITSTIFIDCITVFLFFVCNFGLSSTDTVSLSGFVSHISSVFSLPPLDLMADSKWWHKRCNLALQWLHLLMHDYKWSTQLWWLSRECFSALFLSLA